MDTPWRQTILFVLILSLNDVYVFCQNPPYEPLLPILQNTEVTREIDALTSDAQLSNLLRQSNKKEALPGIREPTTFKNPPLSLLQDGVGTQQACPPTISFKNLVPTGLQLQIGLLNPNLPVPNLPSQPSDAISTPLPLVSPPSAPGLMPQVLLPPPIQPTSCSLSLPNSPSSTIGIVRPLSRKQSTKVTSTCDVPVEKSDCSNVNLSSAVKTPQSICFVKSSIPSVPLPQQQFLNQQTKNVLSEVIRTQEITDQPSIRIPASQQQNMFSQINPNNIFFPLQQQIVNSQTTVNCPTLQPQEPLLNSITANKCIKVLPAQQIANSLAENYVASDPLNYFNSLTTAVNPNICFPQQLTNELKTDICPATLSEQQLLKNKNVINPPAFTIQQQTINSPTKLECSTSLPQQPLIYPGQQQTIKLQNQKSNCLPIKNEDFAEKVVFQPLLPQQQSIISQIQPDSPAVFLKQPSTSLLANTLNLLQQQVTNPFTTLNDCSLLSSSQYPINPQTVPLTQISTTLSQPPYLPLLPLQPLNPFSAINSPVLLPPQQLQIPQKEVYCPTLYLQIPLDTTFPIITSPDFYNIRPFLIPATANLQTTNIYPTLLQEQIKNLAATNYPTTLTQQEFGNILAALAPNLLPQKSIVNPLTVVEYPFSSTVSEVDSLPINLSLPSPNVAEIQPIPIIIPFTPTINSVSPIEMTQINPITTIQEEKETAIIDVPNAIDFNTPNVQLSAIDTDKRQLINEVANILLNELTTELLNDENAQINDIGSQPLNLMTNVYPANLPTPTLILPALPPIPATQPQVPIPVYPPMPVPPIIIEESSSRSKTWLPLLLVALLSNSCGGNGCCGCNNGCNYIPNIPIPYPYPVICNSGNNSNCCKSTNCNKSCCNINSSNDTNDVVVDDVEDNDCNDNIECC